MLKRLPRHTLRSVMLAAVAIGLCTGPLGWVAQVHASAEPGPDAPHGPESDPDGDGAVSDNCPQQHNPGQEDSDGDGRGDVCDTEAGRPDRIRLTVHAPAACDRCADVPGPPWLRVWPLDPMLGAWGSLALAAAALLLIRPRPLPR